MNTAYNTKMLPFMAWFVEEEPRPEDWDDLYSEYIGLRENKSSLYILGIIKEIAYLKAKYQIVEQSCTMLNLCFENTLLEQAKELKDILKQYNFRFAFDMLKPELFARDIRATLSGNKKTITTWQRKEKELEDYQKKHSGDVWKKKDFYIWAVTLSEHQGYRINLEDIFVAEWCQLLNKYEQYCEVKTAQYNSKQYGKGRNR